MNRRTRLAQRTPLRSDPQRTAEWVQASRTPIVRTSGLPPVSARRLEGAGAGIVKSAARKGGAGSSARAESFPPDVAALIDARDPWCIRCGSPHDLHRHHRRIKGIGGDSRPHTDCACNAVRICARCHEWAHLEGRREAEARGLIISRAETAPWRHALMVRTEAETDSGFTAYPTCSGGWVFDSPEGAVA